MDPQELFLSNLDAIDRAIAYVCHRNHLSPQDAEEFNSEVKTKLIEANYAVLRKFEGRSSFSTYMTTVIQRLYFQWRVPRGGKMGRCAGAERPGGRAGKEGRQVRRDGIASDVAVVDAVTGARACRRGGGRARDIPP